MGDDNREKVCDIIQEVTDSASDRLFNEERMYSFVKGYFTGASCAEALRALSFAKEKHATQLRKKGHMGEEVPYIYHPLLVTCHAMALGLTEEALLSACLLHDVCEDCGVAPEELPVSEEAREAVRLVTKAKGFKKTPEEEKAYYNGISGNRIATMVKLLDRVNNVSSMAASFTDEHMAEYIKETEEYVDPLMLRARELYPEYSDALFLIRYHMNSVIGALKHHMRGGRQR